MSTGTRPLTSGRATSAPGRRPPALPAARSSAPGAPSRVSVLAPRTRIDVALPPDVPLADLLPTLLDLAGEAPGGEHDTDPATEGPTGWTLALLGQAPAGADSTLTSLGVLDGDQLVLRRRVDAAPPPLFDDVVDAVAEATPASFRAWDPAWARRLGLVGLGLGPALAATALVLAGRGPWTGGGVVTAVVAGVLAAAAVGLGAVCARTLGQAAAGAVSAGGGVLLAAVAGLAAVPVTPAASDTTASASLLPGAGPAHLMLAAVLTALTAGIALLVLGTASRSGAAALVAALVAAVPVVVVAAIGTVADARGPGTAAGIAAGAGAAALLALSLLPRAGIALARLPLPQVPGSAEELAEDPGTVEQAVLERRADHAHTAMNGLVTGCGLVVAGAATVLAGAPAPGWRGAVGLGLAALLVVLTALRARTYANGVQVAALMSCALAGGAGAGVGWVAAFPADGRAAALVVLVVVPVLALGAGAAALVLGTEVPGRRFSPVARRAVDVAEAVGVAAVLPVALAVTDVYTAVRLW